MDSMKAIAAWFTGRRQAEIEAGKNGFVRIHMHRTPEGEAQRAHIGEVIENWRHDPERSSEDIASAVFVALLNPRES